MRSVFPSLVCTSLILMFGLSPALAQSPDKPPLPEMWTALTARFDSDKVKAGDEVDARVLQSWVYMTCGVNEGTILHGKVVAVNPWADTTKAATVSLSFEAACLDHSKRGLVLMAVFYPTEKEKSQMDTYMAMPQGIGSGASGRQSTNLESMPSPGPGPAENLPLAKFGEVQRIKHLTLAVAKGPQGSTSLTSTEKHLKLDAGTRLAFVPVPEAD